jgi:hypothetical protein
MSRLSQGSIKVSKTSADPRRYGGFRCYYRSARGRLVPSRTGGHYYSNGMYLSRAEAQAAAEREAAELSAASGKRWQAYEV